MNYKRNSNASICPIIFLLNICIPHFHCLKFSPGTYCINKITAWCYLKNVICDDDFFQIEWFAFLHHPEKKYGKTNFGNLILVCSCKLFWGIWDYLFGYFWGNLAIWGFKLGLSYYEGVFDGNLIIIYRWMFELLIMVWTCGELWWKWDWLG